MAKKFKKFGVLGCLIAVEEMADFTLWFQQKYDFFWDQLSFDPSSCFENPTKHLETTFHMPMYIPGPKDNQIWAFRGIFSTRDDNQQQGQWGEKLTIGCFC